MVDHVIFINTNKNKLFNTKIWYKFKKYVKKKVYIFFFKNTKHF